MAKDSKPLDNSVAGEVSYNSTTGDAKVNISVGFGKGLPRDEVQRKLEELFGRYGSAENITIEYK